MLTRLRRLRGWFLSGAVVICAALVAGLVHDFAVPDPQAGWLTGRPAVPAALLTAGFLLMVLHRLAGGE